MLALTYGDKKPRNEARGRLLPNLVPMLEQNNDVKGYFFQSLAMRSAVIVKGMKNTTLVEKGQFFRS